MSPLSTTGTTPSRGRLGEEPAARLGALAHVSSRVGSLTALPRLLCLQEKKGQEVKKGPEVEIAKMDKLLNLVREPDSTAGK